MGIHVKILSEPEQASARGHLPRYLPLRTYRAQNGLSHMLSISGVEGYCHDTFPLDFFAGKGDDLLLEAVSTGK